MNFLQAALFQWLNPKAWVVAVGGVATYTTANGVFAQAFVLAIIFLIVTLPSLAFWTFTGSALRVCCGVTARYAYSIS